jgi:cell filamentation protein, protein adenylyltransferase
MQDNERPDPFTIPGTDTLRNHFNLSGESLDRLERLHTQIRQEQPLDKPDISVAGLKAIHRHLFETVYPWAGEIRTSHSLTKGDASFLPGRFVQDALTRQFELLKSERNLKRLAPEAFAERAAFHIGEINYIHPFREGNGRTLRIFLRELARQAGHDLRLDRIDAEAWMDASRKSRATQDSGPMKQVILRAMTDPLGR